MKAKKLLESMYKQARSWPERPSTAILGLDREGAMYEQTVSVRIHKKIFDRFQELSEIVGMPVEDFMVDCIAHGFIELGMIYDMIKVKEAGELDEMRQAGHVPEH